MTQPEEEFARIKECFQNLLQEIRKGIFDLRYFKNHPKEREELKLEFYGPPSFGGINIHIIVLSSKTTSRKGSNQSPEG